MTTEALSPALGKFTGILLHRAAFPAAPAAIPGAFKTISSWDQPGSKHHRERAKWECWMDLESCARGITSHYLITGLEKKGTEQASSTQNTHGKDLPGAVHCQTPPIPDFLPTSIVALSSAFSSEASSAPHKGCYEPNLYLLFMLEH